MPGRKSKTTKNLKKDSEIGIKKKRPRKNKDSCCNSKFLKLLLRYLVFEIDKEDLYWTDMENGIFCVNSMNKKNPLWNEKMSNFCEERDKLFPDRYNKKFVHEEDHLAKSKARCRSHFNKFKHHLKKIKEEKKDGKIKRTYKFVDWFNIDFSEQIKDLVNDYREESTCKMEDLEMGSETSGSLSPNTINDEERSSLDSQVFSQRQPLYNNTGSQNVLSQRQPLYNNTGSQNGSFDNPHIFNTMVVHIDAVELPGAAILKNLESLSAQLSQIGGAVLNMPSPSNEPLNGSISELDLNINDCLEVGSDSSVSLSPNTFFDVPFSFEKDVVYDQVDHINVRTVSVQDSVNCGVYFQKLPSCSCEVGRCKDYDMEYSRFLDGFMEDKSDVNRYYPEVNDTRYPDNACFLLSDEKSMNLNFTNQGDSFFLL